MEYKTLDCRNVIYRAWKKKQAPYSFWQYNVYWFSDKLGITKIKMEDDIVRKYRPTKPLLLIDIGNIITIKYLLKHLPSKYATMVKQLTGYGITSLDNKLCGYTNKPKYEISWCSAPKYLTKTTSGIDHKLIKYLVKKYNVDGYYHAELPSIIRGKKTMIFTEYAVLFRSITL